jgi:hypothetical protein
MDGHPIHGALGTPQSSWIYPVHGWMDELGTLGLFAEDVLLKVAGAEFHVDSVHAGLFVDPPLREHLDQVVGEDVREELKRSISSLVKPGHARTSFRAKTLTYPRVSIERGSQTPSCSVSTATDYQ